MFFGLSVKGAVTKEMVAPHGGQADHLRDGESGSGDHAGGGARSAARTRSSPPAAATIRTRSTTFSGFPYIFRGALDVRASTINEAMKIAAAEALAKLAREDVPDEVHSASTGRRLTFGPEYIIPNAFDPRLISWVPPAVARAAMDSGVARRPLVDLRRYARELSGRLDPTAGALDAIMESVRDQSEPRGVRRGRGGEGGARRRRLSQRRLRHGRC